MSADLVESLNETIGNLNITHKVKNQINTHLTDVNQENDSIYVQNFMSMCDRIKLAELEYQITGRFMNIDQTDIEKLVLGQLQKLSKAFDIYEVIDALENTYTCEK